MKKIFLSGLFLISIGMSTQLFAKVLPAQMSACTSCHGLSFEKTALQKSKVVSKLSKEEIERALIGYKNGTYGGVMKNLMKSQVSKYSEKELKEISLYIYNLNGAVVTEINNKVPVDEKTMIDKILKDTGKITEIETTNDRTPQQTIIDNEELEAISEEGTKQDGILQKDRLEKGIIPQVIESENEKIAIEKSNNYR